MLNRDNNELELNENISFTETYDVDEEYVNVYEVDDYEIDIDYYEIYAKARREIDIMQKNIEEKEAQLKQHQSSIIEKHIKSKKNYHFDFKATAIFAGILAVIIGASLLGVKAFKPMRTYSIACSDFNKGNYELAIQGFTALGEYKNSVKLLEQAKYERAIELFKAGNYNQAIPAFYELNGYRDSNRRIGQLIGAKTDALAVGLNHTVAIKSIGRVVATGDNSFGQCDVEGWNNITSIAVGANHTVGLTDDGKVVATGDNSNKQCNVGNWENVVAIQAGDVFTIGLKNDGSLYVTGYVGNRAALKSYNNIKGVAKVSSCKANTVCLLDNGSVVVLGSGNMAEIPALNGVTDIVCGKNFIAGITADKKLITSGKKFDAAIVEAGNIQYVEAGGDNLYVVDEKRKVYVTDDGLMELEDALMVALGENHSVAFMTDGSVKAIGDNSMGQCNVADWGDLLLK